MTSGLRQVGFRPRPSLLGTRDATITRDFPAPGASTTPPYALGGGAHPRPTAPVISRRRPQPWASGRPPIPDDSPAPWTASAAARAASPHPQRAPTAAARPAATGGGGAHDEPSGSPTPCTATPSPLDSYRTHRFETSRRGRGFFEVHHLGTARAASVELTGVANLGGGEHIDEAGLAGAADPRRPAPQPPAVTGSPSRSPRCSKAENPARYRLGGGEMVGPRVRSVVLIICCKVGATLGPARGRWAHCPGTARSC